jgi:tRNA A37 threonylcarbamoyladenosine dehydratase
MSRPPAQFSRIARLVGVEGLDRLAASEVCVVGVGAVGGFAVEALARAGVGRLRLVDFDVVNPTNLNRQLGALHSTLGRAKVDVMAERVADINPACRVTTHRLFVHHDTIAEILAGPPNLVLDAIDALLPKVELLAGCLGRDIPVVSSMGAALRTDPGAIRVGSLGKTSRCPLARKVRRRLRRRGLPTDLPCVYSEEPLDALPKHALGADDAHEERELQRGRRRNTLGSLPTIPGMFGLAAANTALRELLGGSFYPTASQPAATP